MAQQNLTSFFTPSSVGVVGASTNSSKLGSQILQNILKAKFSGKIYGINPKFDENTKIPDLSVFDTKNLNLTNSIVEDLDLLVIVTPAFTVEKITQEAIKQKTKNIIIISAGFSEVGNLELEEKITKMCLKNNINLLGPNCLGAIFPYANLNASFANGYPAKGNICFVSQSGAFCTAMLDWATHKNLGFSHFISLGNKSGITEDQILESLADDDQVQVFAFYLESIANPTKFLENIRKVAPHKPIIILEPGASAKAATAAVSHTGSLAPDYKVLQAAYKAAGAIQVTSMQDMFAVMRLITTYSIKDFGENLAVVTNAGGVGVMTTDLSDHYRVNLPDLSDKTQKLLQKALPAEAATLNPVDIIGDAKADRYQTSLEILSEDRDVDMVLILLTPQSTTEVEKTAQIILDIQKTTKKPLIPIFTGGASVESGFEIFQKAGHAAFGFPEEALSALSHIIHRNRNLTISDKGISPISENFRENFQKILELSIQNKLTSLGNSDVELLLDAYSLDRPASGLFETSDLSAGQKFSEKFFKNGQKLVAKISSPEALHKTEMQGVILGLDTEESLVHAWEILAGNIKKFEIPLASIQLQEMVSADLEIFAGTHTDKNFGKILVFGSGGIYTEVYQDTALRVLPVYNKTCLSNLVKSTKAGEILAGTRGMTFPREKVLEVLSSLQQIALDFPVIESIDCNPILVTSERVIFVDVKIVLK